MRKLWDRQPGWRRVILVLWLVFLPLVVVNFFLVIFADTTVLMWSVFPTAALTIVQFVFFYRESMRGPVKPE